VLIAGCGYVGTALARLLVKDGVEVVAIRRSSVISEKGIETLLLDLSDPNVTSKLPQDCSHVVYAVSADSRTKEDYHQAYVQCLQHVLEAFDPKSGPVERFIFVSSTGVYGQDDGSIVTERSVTNPESFTGAEVLSGEGLVRDWGGAATVLRFGGIYGPGRTRLLTMAKSGALSKERLGTMSNRIHLDDCARLLQFILNLRDCPETLIGVDDKPCPLGEVVSWALCSLGQPVVDWEPLPCGKRCDNSLVRSLGFEFDYPDYRAGYASILKEFGTL